MYNSISIKCPEMKSIETDVCVVAWTRDQEWTVYSCGDSSGDSKSKVPNLNCGAGCMALYNVTGFYIKMGKFYSK